MWVKWAVRGAWCVVGAMIAAGCSSSGGGSTEGAGGTAQGQGAGPSGEGGTVTASCGSTCFGCCYEGSCLTLGEQSATVCGTDGATCAACSAGETCANGACVGIAGTGGTSSGGTAGAGATAGTTSHAGTGGAGDAAGTSSGQGGTSAAGTAGAGGGTTTCEQTCPTGCCDSLDQCFLPAEQDWVDCGTHGQACAACPNESWCQQGVCNPGFYDPDANLLLTVTQINSETSCGAITSPDPFVQLVFNDTNPPTTVQTGACSSTTVCAPPSPTFMNVMASELIDGRTTVTALSDNTVSGLTTCWSGPLQFAQGLPISPSYNSPVMGFSAPGMIFTLTPQ